MPVIKTGLCVIFVLSRERMATCLRLLVDKINVNALTVTFVLLCLEVSVETRTAVTRSVIDARSIT